MKKYLSITIGLLIILMSVAAEQNYKEWVQQKIIFLPMDPSSQEYGYRDYSYKEDSYTAIPYKELANQIAVIFKAEEVNGIIKVLLKTEKNKMVYGKGYGKNLESIAFTSELENASQYVSKEVKQKANHARPINLYIREKDTDEYKVINVPKDEKLTVENVEWGTYASSPLKFTLKRANGDLLSWDGSYSRINDTENKLLCPFAEFWTVIEPVASANPEQKKNIENNKPLVDYSNVKGDFKVLVLGDSREVTEQKLDYLVSKEEASLLYSDYEYFETDVLEHTVEVHLEFFSDQLYRITLSFPRKTADYLDTVIKSLVTKDIKSMFVKVYGNPSKSYPYPVIFDLQSGYMNNVYDWFLKNKTISVGLATYEFEYYAEIIISDNKLQKAKDAADKKQKEKAQDKSKSDF